MLDALESLLDSDDAAVVQRHTGPVLEALKALVLRALSPSHAVAAKTPVVRAGRVPCEVDASTVDKRREV